MVLSHHLRSPLASQDLTWFSNTSPRTGGVDPVDFVVPFKKPKEYWFKTAPRLSLAVKVLSAGVQIACAGLPWLFLTAVSY
ncbi:MAG: hypothetical protein ACYSU4_04265 [Planctomycetota bacterium]